MDSLALLCNLHADGPATLQRLRRAGCESLATLLHLEPSDLALQLDWNERLAERFLREAALLSERLEDGLGRGSELEPEPEEDEVEEALELEAEETLEELSELEADEEDEDEDEGFEEDELEVEEEIETGFAPPPARVEAVLGAWRELDRVAPPVDPEFLIPRPPEAAPLPDAGLGERPLAGLTPALRVRLAELGIHGLRDLVAARDLELARALPIGYTRLRRLQFLAARELAQLPALAPAPAASAPVFEAYTPPPSEPFETAGPFA